jgi:hypothetical protein
LRSGIIVLKNEKKIYGIDPLTNLLALSFMISKDCEPSHTSEMLVCDMRCWKYIIGLLLLSACSSSWYECTRVSDAHITFFARGQKIVISDSNCTSGGPGIAGINYISMSATYSPGDSLFKIHGYTDGGGGVSFIFRCIPSKSFGNFPDTSTTVLNLGDSASHWTAYNQVGYTTLVLDSTGLLGNAMVTTDSLWSTDSINTGLIHITGVDETHSTFSGTFNFSARNTNPGSPLSDTIHVDDGVISNMRFTIVSN